MTQEPIFMIAANLDLAGAVSCHEMLLAACETHQLMIEFDGPRPTASALQLAVSARKTLEISDRFRGFGPNASQIFDHISF